jgi:hypothetical protein
VEAERGSSGVKVFCLRMIGDSIFALGALVSGWFILGLITGYSYDKTGLVAEGEWEVGPQAVEAHRLTRSKS